MRLSRKTKSRLSNLLTLVLLIGIIFGSIALIKHVINDKGDDGYVEIHPSYEIGSLNTAGKYVKADSSVYTKEAFKCDGLQVIPDFDNTIKYQLFFYDEDDNFISSTTMGEEKFLDGVPATAKLARILIVPKWDSNTDVSDKKINIFTMYKYTKQLTIRVVKETEEKKMNQLMALL